MAQVQCPNEGGYKVTTKVVKIDRRTGRKVKEPDMGILGWLICSVPFGYGMTLLGEGKIGSGIVLLTIGVSVTALGVWNVNAAKRKYKKKIDEIKKYYHECLICGYRWERREDEPPPEVRVRPDLIAMGEQRLQEEAAAERRRQEEAAAWFLEQQRRRK